MIEASARNTVSVSCRPWRNWRGLSDRALALFKGGYALTLMGNAIREIHDPLLADLSAGCAGVPS